MKKAIIIFGIISTIILSGCVMNKLNTEYQSIILKDAGSGKPLTIDVSTGEQWSSRMQAGPFIFNVLPQAAFWIEDEKGQLIETLYVTGADFKKMRHAGKNADGAAFYSECLPYWASKVKAAEESLPSKNNPYPDTVTSATPMAKFTLQTEIPDLSTIFIFAEFNKSDDVSTFYSKESNDWAGQPSLIYKAEEGSAGAGKTITMEMIGHGGRLDEKAAVYTDMTGIDTALNQVKEIKVSFE